jgi:DNA replication protein DnaC
VESDFDMRLRGMAEAFQQQQEDANIHGLSFEERLGLLIDRQWNWRQNRALERRLRNGRLQGPACVEDIDYRTSRGLDRQLVRSLTAESACVREHQHLFPIGPAGIGKTWLARALAPKTCRDGYTALFLKAAELFRDLAVARADGSHSKLLDRLGRVDLLVVDDWAMAPMNEPERRDFLRSVTPVTRRAPRCLSANCRWRAGTRRSAIPPSPTASSTGSSTTRAGLNCRASRCGKSVASLRRRSPSVRNE